LGRRRRRVVKIIKKKLPTVFICPSCGEEAVKISKEATRSIVHCGACGLKDELEAAGSAQPVDIYCKFTDKFYATGRPPSSESKTTEH